MSTIRGRGRALDIAIDRRPGDAVAELREQLAARPDFFRGSRGTANFGRFAADAGDIVALRDLLAAYGITLDGVSGLPEIEAAAAALDVAYLGADLGEPSVAPLARARAARGPVALSDEARTLVADFAGARADLAARRTERATAAERPPDNAVAVRSAAADVAPPAPAAVSSTHYHRGTLRGGQALHHLGNIVIVGDVNPGAEVIASGDIVVFGALRGVAHAGAQGDSDACVIALEMQPTQLRIATSIAAGDGAWPAGAAQASLAGDRIAVTPHGSSAAGRPSVTP